MFGQGQTPRDNFLGVVALVRRVEVVVAGQDVPLDVCG